MRIVSGKYELCWGHESPTVLADFTVAEDGKVVVERAYQNSALDILPDPKMKPQDAVRRLVSLSHHPYYLVRRRG